MKLIAIQDANILIDLVNTGLFDHCLSLQYQFTSTNILLDELHDEQVALIQPHINSGKFYIIENVPARVNQDTGEELFSIKTVERLQKMVWDNNKPLKVLETPVYEFT